MSYEDAYTLITWTVILVAGVPFAWAVLDWWFKRPR